MRFDIKAIKKQLSLKLSTMDENQLYYGDSLSVEQILKHINLTKSHLALDLGAGYGFLAQSIAPSVKNVIAVDINPEMVAEGLRIGKNKRLENIEYIYSDAEQLEFDNDSFDFIFCYFSAHHFTNLTKALSEAYRVLKSDGKLVLIDYAVSDKENLREFANKIENLRDPGHVCLHTLEDWKGLLAEQGFSVLKTDTRGQLIDFDKWSDGASTPEFIKNHLKQVLLNCNNELKKHYNISEKEGKVSFEYCELFTLAEKT